MPEPAEKPSLYSTVCFGASCMQMQMPMFVHECLPVSAMKLCHCKNVSVLQINKNIHTFIKKCVLYRVHLFSFEVGLTYKLELHFLTNCLCLNLGKVKSSSDGVWSCAVCLTASLPDLVGRTPITVGS